MLANHEGRLDISTILASNPTLTLLRVWNKYRQIETQKTVSDYRQM